MLLKQNQSSVIFQIKMFIFCWNIKKCQDFIFIVWNISVDYKIPQSCFIRWQFTEHWDFPGAFSTLIPADLCWPTALLNNLPTGWFADWSITKWEQGWQEQTSKVHQLLFQCCEVAKCLKKLTNSKKSASPSVLLLLTKLAYLMSQ